MTEQYYVFVAGTGETSRANIEALMEDHYYANGDKGTLVVAFNDSPTKSQTYAAQYAKDCNKDIVVFSHSGAHTAGIPSATAISATDPVQEAVSWLKGQKTVAFLLWDESDGATLKACLEADIQAFNLCDGLYPLTSAPDAPKKLDTPVKKPVEVVEASPVRIATADASLSEIRARVKDAMSTLQAVLNLIEAK